MAVAALASLLDSSPKPALAGHSCASTGSPAGPFQMQAYEAADYKTSYARTMELAGLNQLFPEQASFSLPAMERGDRSLGSSQTAPGFIPPVLLKAVAWIESGWAQASYDPFVAYGEVGPTLVSHDCGYGIMQVTSGMQNVTGVPNLDQAMIGGHYAFNIARGARILADKWNQAPEFRPLVGDRNPGIVENWYYALWSYNGFAFKNHPLNPSYDPNRPPFSCAPDGDGLGHNTSAYPYQELVMGCIAHPPVRGGVQLWAPVDVTLPNRADPAFAGPLSLANWEPCALGQACAAMDFATPNPTHQLAASPGEDRDQVIGVPTLGATPTSLSLTAQPDRVSSPVDLTVLNTGGGLLAWRATSSATWLKLDRNQGVSLAAELGGISQGVNVTANAASMIPGLHTATITIESLFAVHAPLVVTVNFHVGQGPQAWRTGDFNGDGKMDMAHLCCWDYINVWLSRGDGSFEIVKFQPWVGYWVQAGSWQTGDFNGDGKTDLAHLCCAGYGHIWTSVGDGSFSVSMFPTWPGYSVQAGPWSSGDFNGDGRTDLIHQCCQDHAIVWTANGDGTFGASMALPWAGYSMASGTWQQGDFNGDGKTDFVHLCCYDYANLWLSRGDGTFDVSVFKPRSDYWVQSGSWQAGDFDGDGKTDLAHLCCFDYINIWTSRGDGTFAVDKRQASVGYWVQSGSWRVGDINADHRADLIHLCCYDYANVWTATGGGNFSVAPFQPWPNYWVQSGVWRSGDFTGDGRTDLAHLCCFDYVHVWSSYGNGTFGISKFQPWPGYWVVPP